MLNKLKSKGNVHNPKENSSAFSDLKKQVPKQQIIEIQFLLKNLYFCLILNDNYILLADLGLCFLFFFPNSLSFYFLLFYNK